MLRRKFGQKRDKIIVTWRRPYNEEQYTFFSSPKIITMTKSRMMR
jgi:hypothetical protein